MRRIVVEECESTNTVAITLGEQGAEHGTAVVANSQTAGKGRLGRIWQSPAGKGLYCSVLVRPSLAAEDYPRLTFAAGIAVATVIEDIYGVRPGLKWPNDIYFKQRKCGGILNEAVGLAGPVGNRFAVIGIGVNVNTRQEEFDPAVGQRATSLYLETGKEYIVLDLFAALHQRLLSEIKGMEEGGFPEVLNRWRAYDFLKGKRMTWVTVHGERVDGFSLGPDSTGSLYVMDDRGQTHQVLSGDVELWQGSLPSAADR